MSIYRGFVRSDRKDSISQNMMYNYRHQSGFHVSFISKPGFVRKFAAFGIPYGAADLRFTTEEDFERYHHAKAEGKPAEPPMQVFEVYPGSAHYLEHCIFSRDDDGGLIGQLSALGAQANAYTGDSETVYYFSTVDHFDQAMLLYFDALVSADLSEERIEDERDIIAAELTMYEDDPDSMADKHVLAQLYSVHGLKHDVGGTAESIHQITAASLQNISDHFYTPSAMNLLIVGDFPEDDMVRIIDLLADRLDPMKILPKGINLYVDEPAHVNKKIAELRLDVEVESFHIGFKNPMINRYHSANGSYWALIQTQGQLYCDAIIGDTSPLYQELYSEGIINDSFSVQFTCGHDYNYVMMGGESEQPELAVHEVARRFRAAVAGDLLDRDVFQIQKKALHGDFVRSLDHIEASGMAGLEARLYGCDLFDHAAVFSRLNADDAGNFMKFVLDEGSMTKLILRKRGI